MNFGACHDGLGGVNKPSQSYCTLTPTKQRVELFTNRIIIPQFRRQFNRGNDEYLIQWLFILHSPVIHHVWRMEDGFIFTCGMVSFNERLHHNNPLSFHIFSPGRSAGPCSVGCCPILILVKARLYSRENSKEAAPKNN